MHVIKHEQNVGLYLSNSEGLYYCMSICISAAINGTRWPFLKTMYLREHLQRLYVLLYNGHCF